MIFQKKEEKYGRRNNINNIYISALIGFSVVLDVIMIVKGINYKKALIISDLFVLVGVTYISFSVLKEQDLYFKYLSIFAVFIFLVIDIYRYTMPKSKLDEIKEDEIKWRQSLENK